MRTLTPLQHAQFSCCSGDTKGGEQHFSSKVGGLDFFQCTAKDQLPSSLPPTVLESLSTKLDTTFCAYKYKGPTSQDAEKIKPDAFTSQRSMLL